MTIGAGITKAWHRGRYGSKAITVRTDGSVAHRTGTLDSGYDQHTARTRVEETADVDISAASDRQLLPHGESR